MNTREKLHHSEQGRRAESLERGTAGRLTEAMVQEVVRERSAVFATVERQITVRLREVLREKIETEKKLLLAIVARRARAAEKMQAELHVLHRSFFELKQLDTYSIDA